MRSRGLAVVLAVVVASALGLGAGVAVAAPGDGSGDIDMDADAGSGSGSGSATPPAPPAAPPAAPSTAPAPSPDAGTGSADAGEPAIVKDPKVAKKWLAAAQQLVSKGDYYTNRKKPDDAKAQYTNALTAYQKAIEAGDDVGVNYALALVEDKLGAEPDAYKHLKLVVAAQPPVKADLLKKAQAKLDEVAGKVGLVTLSVMPEGTMITIAGAEIGEAPLKEPIVLAPGTYTVAFTLVGYQPKETELKIEAGAEAEKKIELEPVPIKIQPHVEPEPEPPPVVVKPSKLPLIVGASATGLFTLGAVIFGASAISQHNAYTDPTFTKKERADAQSLGRTMAHLCDASIGVAVLSAAFTVYWYQFKYKKELEAPPPGLQPREVPKVDMVPWVQPGAGGIAAVGSF